LAVKSRLTQPKPGAALQIPETLIICDSTQPSIVENLYGATKPNG
jgi:hypothetical protein